MNDLITIDWTNTIITRKQASVWWCWFKACLSIFLLVKDVNFCLAILLFFRQKISGHFTKTSGHEFVQMFILNTVRSRETEVKLLLKWLKDLALCKCRVWYQRFYFQGFCCHCTTSEKNAHTFGEAKNYKRAGLTCKFATKSSQSSAHCMRYDDLW